MLAFHRELEVQSLYQLEALGVAATGHRGSCQEDLSFGPA